MKLHILLLIIQVWTMVSFAQTITLGAMEGKSDSDTSGTVYIFDQNVQSNTYLLHLPSTYNSTRTATQASLSYSEDALLSQLMDASSASSIKTSTIRGKISSEFSTNTLASSSNLEENSISSSVNSKVSSPTRENIVKHTSNANSTSTNASFSSSRGDGNIVTIPIFFTSLMGLMAFIL
ncbi:uncharacterized protein NDAI_0E01760 [Naumovozyma dairenensis CBS 421]|uniref:Uncharacterized protein n=1 Tax=Naumovozyma dairenensis (strain ATCC 10597 / BCRC 20456 / CBS 421 / NBRC 0211 / NRRL Y-12639) TaxID=1071378 RepID=G0WB72_NAUDC|nr:hypothetical protein NDAI_0E01760 [Naumovozyma dairenensis CBS 421]CCD24992.1 hypothetical protein NDAI_0E01760 [Naumovozyma dairenensis CBS 421]